ncbi:hypothetical protein [Bosea vestrisii]|uniref:leucine--tRNA ligase n=1 Tax=Bosea vestrisii TaxID=151416 RepID=A0ABW0HHP2_9HYPH
MSEIVISSVGAQGEGILRQLRRAFVAEVFARYASQISLKRPRLFDIPAIDGATRRQFIPGAISTLNELLDSRLIVRDDQLVLRTDDLLGPLLDARGEVRWPDAILAAHRDVIGGSRGARVRFARTDGRGDIEVFTTRPDTLFGATFICLSPSHPAALTYPAKIDAFQAECNQIGDDPNAKVGVPLGISVRHPFLPARTIPIWLANFVIEGYGTGAAGGCPACDQRDLDFARRYNLPVRSIVCPPGADPATFEVGDSAYSGDGTIINSGFLSGLPVSRAIGAASARLVELGCGEPTVQYRGREVVVANSSSPNESDARHFDRPWRFSGAFLTATAAISTTTFRPHVLHVTVPEAKTRHLLDARILLSAVLKGRETAYREPWEEIIFVGDVVGAGAANASDVLPSSNDAFRLALLADTPSDRDLEWSDKRYFTALKFLTGVTQALESSGGPRSADRTSLAMKISAASATLEQALGRYRTNTAIAAARDIIDKATEVAGAHGLDGADRQLIGSLLYPFLPDLARQLDGAGQIGDGAPAWPRTIVGTNDGGLIEVIVQINGKKRGSIHVARDADEETLIAAVRAHSALKDYLGGKPVRKTVVVLNRLINLVV